MARAKFRKALLIDDDMMTNKLNYRLMKKLDIADEIVIAQNGQEALKMLNAANVEFPDLILLDINMPIMNGFEFMKEYESSHSCENKRVIVMMLTTSLQSKDFVIAREFASISEFMSKPLSPNKIRQIKEKYLA